MLYSTLYKSWPRMFLEEELNSNKMEGWPKGGFLKMCCNLTSHNWGTIPLFCLIETAEPDINSSPALSSPKSIVKYFVIFGLSAYDPATGSFLQFLKSICSLRHCYSPCFLSGESWSFVLPHHPPPNPKLSLNNSSSPTNTQLRL